MTRAGTPGSACQSRSGLRAPELWWDHAQPLYEAGRYAEAADKGVALIEARRDQPYL
jgi:hypothetical protein